MSACAAHDMELAGFQLDPWVIGPLVVSLSLYVVGWIRLGLGSRQGAILYLTAWSLLTFVLVTPFHELAERSFSIHMIEHEIIMAASAPLFVSARPYGVLLWGLPRGIRARAAEALHEQALRKIWGVLCRPLNATLIQGAVIWLWHLPVLFDATVNSVTIHRWQHMSFIVSALLFWYALSLANRAGQALACLSLTMLHTSILGALLALAPHVLYPFQTLNAGDFGLSPLEDQQLAGILMWVPAGTIYAGAALVYAARWIRGGAHRAYRPGTVIRGNHDAL